jgi:hypothetical protein
MVLLNGCVYLISAGGTGLTRRQMVLFLSRKYDKLALNDRQLEDLLAGYSTPLLKEKV